VDVVALSLVSAFCFGALSVALRFALVRVPDADIGALATALAAFALAGAYALADRAAIDLEGVAIFAVAGFLSPGTSQLLFTFAVRDAGASRTSVITGAAPLFAVALALVALGEPFKVPLIVGAALIVLGGFVLVMDRDRPAHVRGRGLALAAAGAFVFAVRDAYVRSVADDVGVAPSAAAAIALGAGAVAILAFTLITRRGKLPSPQVGLPFVPAGLLFGLSYLFLYEAFYRGRVTVVSPLVATEALFAVLLSTVLLRRTELIGTRLVMGTILVVAGGALIGAFR
jgi:drug/metabolite transporter (DMT)-like permease